MKRNRDLVSRSSLPWSEGLSGWLVQRAARRAPADLAERLAEEWSADLQARSSSFARLRFAVGCCWATRVIAYEQAELVPVAQGAGGKLAMAHPESNVGFYSGRTLSLMLVIAVHAAVLGALMLFVAGPKKPMAEAALQPQPMPDPTRPLFTGDRFDPLFNVPPVDPKNPPEAKVEDGPTDTSAELPTSSGAGPAVPQALPPHAVVHRDGGLSPGFPDPALYYPTGEVRREHQGASVVRVCTDAKGRLTREPETSVQSPYPALDEAARKLAAAGSGHYRAAQDDGVSVASCFPVQIRFRLNN
jgi:hypothetical protein